VHFRKCGQALVGLGGASLATVPVHRRGRVASPPSLRYGATLLGSRTRRSSKSGGGPRRPPSRAEQSAPLQVQAMSLPGRCLHPRNAELSAVRSLDPTIMSRNPDPTIAVPTPVSSDPDNRVRGSRRDDLHSDGRGRRWPIYNDGCRWWRRWWLLINSFGAAGNAQQSQRGQRK